MSERNSRLNLRIKVAGVILLLVAVAGLIKWGTGLKTEDTAKDFDTSAGGALNPVLDPVLDPVQTFPAVKAAGTSTVSGTVDTGCFLVTLTHKPLPEHKNRQHCSRHRNYVRLGDSSINLKSLCVRVDSVPVRYELVEKKNKKGIQGLMISSGAGPNSKITVRYCIGKKSCPETKTECAVPKDDFLDAIGGSDPEEDTRIRIVKWDPNDASQDVDVAASIEADLKKELADAEPGVFDEWIGTSEAASCRQRVANK